MSNTEDVARELATQGAIQTTPLNSSSPLTVPKIASWKDITIEHHRQPAAECLLRLPKHTVCLLLRDSQTERRVNGGRLHSNHVQRGDVIVYPATSEHWVRWQEPAEFLLLFLEPDRIERAIDELTTRSNLELFVSETERDDQLMLQVALALQAEIEAGLTAYSSLYADSLANTLSAHLLRHYSVEPPALQEAVDGHFHSAAMLRHVIEYIHDNLDQPLSLAELSQIADMSPYHFARSFKRVMGVPPHSYVLNERIKQAKNMLLQGKLTIAEIASRVGFFDQSHFTRAFKRLVGITPQTLVRQSSKNIPE